LIAPINFFDVGHMFLSLGCNKSNDLTVLPIWLAWLLDLDLKIWLRILDGFFYLCFSFVLVQVHHQLVVRNLRREMLQVYIYSKLEEHYKHNFKNRSIMWYKFLRKNAGI
jgi:hypothetical protein